MPVLTAAMRGNVGLDRLRKREDDRGTMLGRAQQKLIVSIAEIAGFEEDGRRIGSTKYVK